MKPVIPDLLKGDVLVAAAVIRGAANEPPGSIARPDKPLILELQTNAPLGALCLCQTI